MNNYVQLFHRIKSTVRQPVYHSQCHSLFAPTLVAVRFLLLHWGKTGWNHGIIVTFTCLEPQYFPGNPSSQPCIGKPLGFGLPYPSTCQPTFGPGEMYDRHGSFLAFRRADAYGSSSRQPWRPSVEGQQHCNFLFILFILHIDGKLFPHLWQNIAIHLVPVCVVTLSRPSLTWCDLCCISIFPRLTW